MFVTYSGFWKRLAAIIIDAILIAVIRSILIIPILIPMGLSTASQPNSFDSDDPSTLFPVVGKMFVFGGISTLISSLIWILYFSLMESSKHQATLGKLALGIKVTDINGDSLDFTKALLRNLCKIISSFILFIGYIMAAFTEKKQALHDMIAGTLVVEK